MSAAPLFLLLAAAASTGVDSPNPEAPPGQAKLMFQTGSQPFVSPSAGIDGIDSQRTVYGERLSADLSSGRRTVWYTCPDQPAMEGGSRMTFDFEAGEVYELVCHAGGGAEIRPAGC